MYKRQHKELAEFIINSLDGNGYLQLKDEDIQRMLPQYSLDDIEDTINEIQTFEPAGVCARSLQECLLIQLCFEDIPYSQIAIMIVNFYLKEVSENKLPAIAEALQIPLELSLIHIFPFSEFHIRWGSETAARQLPHVSW